jgi:hypothetical protein
MRTALCLLLFSLGLGAVAKDNASDYARIPEALSRNAHALIRTHHQDMERISEDLLKTTVVKAVTVLSNPGREHAVLHLPYDKNTKVLKISGKVFDAQGRVIRTLKKKDFSDYSAFQDFIFFSDQRILHYQPGASTYPFTVEYSYTIQTKGLIHIDLWTPVEDYNLAVEQATLRVATPGHLPLDFRMKNYEFAYETIENGNNTIHQWEIKDFQALRKVPYAPHYLSIFPYLSVAPLHYRYDKYSETVSDWKSYGKWVGQLLEGKQELPKATQSRMQALTDSLPDERSKVKAIYQYMQKKTRYVCITEGIGGYQPMSAGEVDLYGYGDCKALSNYTQALLASINIPSFYTEIGADSRRIRHPDFASADQTNHVILTVPLEQDTIWLECTNPYNPFAYVGEALANRYALAVTPQGGALITMPSYKAEDNHLDYKLELKLSPNGDASAQLTSTAKGLRFEDLHFLTTGTSQQQKDYLLSHLPIKNLSINNFSISEKGDKDAQATLAVEFNAGQYAHPSGNRLFLPLNTVSPVTLKINNTETRAFDLNFKIPGTDTGHFVYEIPEGFEVEFFPSEILIENDYLSFRSNCELSGNKLSYRRSFTLKQNQIPKASFTDFVETLEKIRNQDNPTAILKKI